MQRWQILMSTWSQLVFRERFAEITPKIRALRVLEEAMELAQAEGVTRDECDIIKTQVWDKPAGDPFQEVGGILTTLAGYGATKGLDIEVQFWSEFERIMNPDIMEKVRKRNLEGDKIGFENPEPFSGNRVSNSEKSGILILEKDWLPIDQFKDEIDNFTTEVLVNNQIVTGVYECGHTWGWTDERGNHIHPTHFRNNPKTAEAIKGLPTLNTLSLQFGKTYRSRAGGEFTILGEVSALNPARSRGYRFVSDNDIMYKANGTYLESGEESAYDLIEEVVMTKPLELINQILNMEKPDRALDVEIHNLIGPIDPPYNATCRTLRNGKPSCPEYTSDMTAILKYLVPKGWALTITLLPDGKGKATLWDGTLPERNEHSKALTTTADTPAIAAIIQLITVMWVLK